MKAYTYRIKYYEDQENYMVPWMDFVIFAPNKKVAKEYCKDIIIEEMSVTDGYYILEEKKPEDFDYEVVNVKVLKNYGKSKLKRFVGLFAGR